MKQAKEISDEKLEVVWEPQPGPQTALLTCPVFETLFGGARGGGKSDGVLGEWASHADICGKDAIGLCVRRERIQLTELIERSKVLYGQLGARFQEIDKMWRFPNGARLRFAYLENDSDALAYQGHSYSRVYVEEMGTFPNFDPIKKLMATLRTGNPEKVTPRFIATANPGGPGHLWIKQRYIDPAPSGYKILPTEYKNPFTGEIIWKERVFIPSRVTDNKYTNTSEYIGNLYMAGNDELVRAWLLGDWNVTLGAYFSEWDTTKHVIKTFKIPNHWIRFMSMDWGSAKPFSVGWWAVVPDETDTFLDIPSYDLSNKRIFLPKGAIIRYREWYGTRATTTTENRNVGLKLTAKEVAAGIRERERNEPRNEYGRSRIAYRVADPSMFRNDGGPSHAEEMGKFPNYISLRRADNTHISKRGAMGGLDQVRARLKGDEDSRPMIYFMDNCIDAIRTLPALQHDENHIEDIDENCEDHAPDEIRYACMSRPYFRSQGDDIVRRLLKSSDNSLVLHDDLMEIKSENKFNQLRIN